MDKDKQEIINLFRKNVKGKSPNIHGVNMRHDGKVGHWLESQFGISHNASNSSDLYGYELKNETTSGKTTFGDWSANVYIYSDSTTTHLFSGYSILEKRNSFIRMFGKPNMDKGGRYSWSGEPIPKINEWNSFGQILKVLETKDIAIIYNYQHDKRGNKDDIIREQLRNKDIYLALWFGYPSLTLSKSKCLKDKLEDKFNNKGWFTCKTNSNGVYDKICFGKPINFENWIELVKEGIVFFDSGMYESNNRPYSQWRANNSFWDSLITECYE